MRTWIGLGVLLLVVAALGAWVYQRPAKGRLETYALSELKPDNVKRISLQRPGKEPATIVLERNHEGWRMLQPFRARADAFHVERLLAVLELRSAARYPASDLARYGLDEPQATLTLGDQTFAYGSVNAMTREQYVLTRDAVYAVPLGQRNALPGDAHALISRALFAAGELPVRIEGRGFVAVSSEGAWTITPSDDLSPDARNAWADAWRNARAVQATPYDGTPAKESIRIELKNRHSFTLGVRDGGSEILLIRSDEGIQYHFFPETAKRLLSPPSSGERSR